MLILLSAGIAPGLALLSYFYLKDQYDEEPIITVFKVFVFGAILTFPIMFLQYVIDAENILQNSLLQSFISIALSEEFFKWFLIYIAVYQLEEFDEPYDGIVYGASISLGFATLENILYLLSNGLEYAFGRAIFPVSSHALFGVIMGYYFGKAKFDKQNKKVKWLVYSFAIPFVLHGLYDYILVGFKKWVYVLIPFMLFLWWFALKKVKHAHMATHQHHIQKYEKKRNLS